MTFVEAAIYARRSLPTLWATGDLDARRQAIRVLLDLSATAHASDDDHLAAAMAAGMWRNADDVTGAMFEHVEPRQLSADEIEHAIKVAARAGIDNTPEQLRGHKPNTQGEFTRNVRPSRIRLVGDTATDHAALGVILTRSTGTDGRVDALALRNAADALMNEHGDRIALLGTESVATPETTPELPDAQHLAARWTVSPQDEHTTDRHGVIVRYGVRGLIASDRAMPARTLRNAHVKVGTTNVVVAASMTSGLKAPGAVGAMPVGNVPLVDGQTTRLPSALVVWQGGAGRTAANMSRHHANVTGHWHDATGRLHILDPRTARQIERDKVRTIRAAIRAAKAANTPAKIAPVVTVIEATDPATLTALKPGRYQANGLTLTVAANGLFTVVANDHRHRTRSANVASGLLA